MVETYARPLQERFLASRCSVAYLFRLAWYIAIAVAPIYIAYSSGGFWRRSDVYLEQPVVHFTKNLIAVGTSADGTRVIQYSTMERFNHLVGYQHVKQPALKSWATDPNLDGKPDTWDIQLSFPMSASDPGVVSVTLLLFFQLQLTAQVSVDMNAMVAVSGGGGGAAGNHLLLAGDLELFQRNPLARASSLGPRSVYRHPLVNDSTLRVLDDADIGALVLANEARNETLRFHPRSVWSRTPAQDFNVSVRLTVPTMPVRYVPGPSEAIKFAWIQWLACFWLLYFGMKFIRDFVYSQNIVDTMRVVDGTPIAKLHHF